MRLGVKTACLVDPVMFNPITPETVFTFVRGLFF
jgi:hypothetical protein